MKIEKMDRASVNAIGKKVMAIVNKEMIRNRGKPKPLDQSIIQ